MKNTETYLSDVECSDVIFVEEEEDASRREGGPANRTALHNTLLPARSLPNILRNSSNTKVHKSCETPTSDKMDTYFLMSSEHASTSFELNATLSSVSSEKDVNYDRVASSKAHHQRKQVHNPLNLQCDAPDWNNNKKKRLLQTVGPVDTLQQQVPPANQEDSTASLKKFKLDAKAKKHSHERKAKKVKLREAVDETRVSIEKSSFDFGLIAIPDVKINDQVVVLQNVDHFVNSDTLHSVRASTAPSCTSRSDISAALGSQESNILMSNVPYYNNEFGDVKGTYGINRNPVISGGSTEFNGLQYKASQSKLASDESLAMGDLGGELMDGDSASSYLFKPKVLYTCSCVNCTTYDKDIVFYEDPVSTSTSGDNSEAELYSRLCDFYSDYYHIFGDIGLMGLNNENLYWEEIEATNIVRENSAYADCNSVAQVLENNASVLSVEQSGSEDVQACRIDKVQDIAFETCPTEFISSPKSSKGVEDKTSCPNFETVSLKNRKIASQEEELARNAVSTDAPDYKSKFEERQKKQGNKRY